MRSQEMVKVAGPVDAKECPVCFSRREIMRAAARARRGSVYPVRRTVKPELSGRRPGARVTCAGRGMIESD